MDPKGHKMDQKGHNVDQKRLKHMKKGFGKKKHFKLSQYFQNDPDFSR